MKTGKQVSFSPIKALKVTKKNYITRLVGRQNLFISLWWAAVLPTLRTTGLDRGNVTVGKLNSMFVLNK